jgi:hypothetical protein
MEQGKEGMEKNLDGQNELREYLLGTLDDPAKMRQIEERLMQDDNFGPELSGAEDELIEQYLDDELSDAEQERFESFFLSTPDRASHFRVSRNLRKYALHAKAAAASTAVAGAKKAGFFDWRQYFSLPVVRFATVLLVMIGLGYGVWRVGFYRSDLDLGLSELHLAYKNDRRLNARIVGFEYSPPPMVTRGPGDRDKPETDQSKRAAAILAAALNDKRSAETLYATGKVSLAKRDLETAISRFEEAAALAPQNADIHSDLGAAYLEMGEATVTKDTTKGLELLDNSLKHLEKAAGLNPKLLEPRFNLGLVFERVDPERAKKAWNDYIALDPSSKWTEEARSRLKDLNEKP